MDENTKGAISILPEGFYDILSILIPGLCLISVFYFVGFADLSVPTDIYHFLGYILIAYIAGHVLYTTSGLLVPELAKYVHGPDPRCYLLDEKGTKYPAGKLFIMGEPARNELVWRIREKWGFPIHKEQPLTCYMYYELCRNYVHIKNLERASFVRKEMAYGEMARSLSLVCLIALGAILYTSIDFSEKCVWGGLSAAGFLVFFWRYLSARQINAKFVYYNFMILRQEELESAKSSEIELPKSSPALDMSQAQGTVGTAGIGNEPSVN